jgi:hypothetical protein
MARRKLWQTEGKVRHSNTAHRLALMTTWGNIMKNVAWETPSDPSTMNDAKLGRFPT